MAANSRLPAPCPPRVTALVRATLFLIICARAGQSLKPHQYVLGPLFFLAVALGAEADDVEFPAPVPNLEIVNQHVANRILRIVRPANSRERQRRSATNGIGDGPHGCVAL